MALLANDILDLVWATFSSLAHPRQPLYEWRSGDLDDWLRRNPQHAERVLVLEERLKAEGHDNDYPGAMPSCRSPYRRVNGYRRKGLVPNPDYRKPGPYRAPSRIRYEMFSKHFRDKR